MLAERLLKSQIKRAFAERFGPTPARTLEWYLARARGQMREVLEATKKDHAVRAVAFLEGVIRNPKAPMRDKLRAQEQLSAIVGLEEAKRWNLSVENKGSGEQSTAGKIDAIFGIVRDPVRANGNLNGHVNGEDREAREALG